MTAMKTLFIFILIWFLILPTMHESNFVPIISNLFWMGYTLFWFFRYAGAREKLMLAEFKLKKVGKQ